MFKCIRNYRDLKCVCGRVTYSKRNTIYRYTTFIYCKISTTSHLFVKRIFKRKISTAVGVFNINTFSLGYQHVSREKVEESKVDAVNNLYLGGTYEFLKGISVYARINNLLNRDYQYYWGYPTEGINFIGGVSFKF